MRGKGAVQNPALVPGCDEGGSLTSGHPSSLSYHRELSQVNKRPERLLRAKACGEMVEVKLALGLLREEGARVRA